MTDEEHVTTLHHDGFKHYFTCSAGDVTHTDNAYDTPAEAEVAAEGHRRRFDPPDVDPVEQGKAYRRIGWSDELTAAAHHADAAGYEATFREHIRRNALDIDPDRLDYAALATFARTGLTPEDDLPGGDVMPDDDSDLGLRDVDAAEAIDAATLAAITDADELEEFLRDRWGENVLDDDVHSAKSMEASDINNEGLAAQIAYLSDGDIGGLAHTLVDQLYGGRSNA